jgi:hypothetical protein
MAVSDQPADDFTRIHGIGQAVEQRLHQAGILTYQQLADRSPQQLAAWVEDMVGFTEERIREQDWPGEAAQFAAQAEASQKTEQEAKQGLPSVQQHHGYTVELFLDEDRQVRRTRVQHIRTKEEDSWTGWDGTRLKRFLIDTAEVAAAGEGQLESNQTRAAGAKAEKAGKPAHRQQLAGKLRVLNMNLFGRNGQEIKMLAQEGERINVRLELDLSHVERAGDGDLHYEAQVYARPVVHGERFLVGSAQGKLIQVQEAHIDIPGERLSAGQYRLEAVVSLRQPGASKTESAELMALSEGNYLQVVGMN